MPVSLPPEPSPAFFLAVRRGVPLALALTALGAALAFPGLRGWTLVAAVGLFAELLPTFRRGEAHLRTRSQTIRWDGGWVVALRPLFRPLGLDRAWVLSFCAWNNRRVREAFAGRPARKALVLLPHCIQMASCRAGILEEIGACHRCGLCPVGDLLDAQLARHWDVCLANRSHKIYRRARDFAPDLVVAVSCPDRLLKGLTRMREVPAYAIPLELPHGWCVDTRFHVPHLAAAMEALVAPREDRILPLDRTGIA